MPRVVLKGIIAGAAGTVALNTATYADMAIRGRPSSGMPAMVVEELLKKAGMDPGDGETAQTRKTALGALMGLGVGVGIGASYVLASPRRGSTLLSGAALGLAAMAASDVPAAVLGVTDPAEWSANSWLSDIVPHFIYGAVTAAAYKAMAGDR